MQEGQARWALLKGQYHGIVVQARFPGQPALQGGAWDADRMRELALADPALRGVLIRRQRCRHSWHAPNTHALSLGVMKDGEKMNEKKGTAIAVVGLPFLSGLLWGVTLTSLLSRTIDRSLMQWFGTELVDFSTVNGLIAGALLLYYGYRIAPFIPTEFKRDGEK